MLTCECRDTAKPKSRALVSLFFSPTLQKKAIIKLFSTGCRRVSWRGFRDQSRWGGELTGSGAEGRCSHNLQSDQRACYSVVRIDRLLCRLIVGIEASGISIPLFLLMLLGWSVIWIATLTPLVYQWGLRSINLTLLQIGICLVSSEYSESAEVWVRANCVSRLVMFFYILSPREEDCVVTYVVIDHRGVR